MKLWKRVWHGSVGSFGPRTPTFRFKMTNIWVYIAHSGHLGDKRVIKNTKHGLNQVWRKVVGKGCDMGLWGVSGREHQFSDLK